MIISFLLLCYPFGAYGIDAKQIVKNAINYWRDDTSYTEAEMIIHRPDWERRTALKVWTKGTKLSLVRFTAPAKDAGNASLTIDKDMWSFSPKISRVMKIPPSMMSQSWMGSDFSYDDLSRSDKIIDQYTHSLVSEATEGGKKVYTIESIPKEDAPVVWGKELLKIRDDNIILEHIFFDQDLKPIKRFTANEIKLMGGKMFATVIRITKVEEPGEWTEVVHNIVDFSRSIPDLIFTVSNLSNPRE